MSFSKDSFEKAKKKASERLTEWISDVKDRGSGIPRLQKEFKQTFKKIAWKPKLSDENEETEDDNEEIKRERDIKLLESILEESLGNKRKPSVVLPVLKLDEHQIHDSNSSNISSRTGRHREEIRYADRRTPFVKTPFSQGDLEVLDGLAELELKDKTSENDRVPADNRRRGGIHPQMSKICLEFVRKRKRKKAKAYQNGPVRKSDSKGKMSSHTCQSREDVATLQREALSDDHDSLLTSIVKKESSNALSKTKSSTVKPTSKGYPVDLIFNLKRSFKPKRHFVSKTDLAVMKTERTSEEDRKDILHRFRRLVRLLIHVRVLLNVSRLRMEEEEKSKGFKRFDGGHELSFDAGTYKTAISYGGLTNRAREALKKKPDDRNEEDAKILMEVMLRLPVFIKYPKAVKQDLARKMWYDCFQNGRVIVKQGDPGTRMYFVVSGEVDLKRTDMLESGEESSYHLRTITAGSTFGELALIRDMRREFTAICKGTSEFLSLSKSEFNQALRSRWEKECNLRFNFLRNCDQFSPWTDRQLQICADSSELKEYTDNSVIIGDIDGLTESVFFIRKGRCDVVRRMLVVRHQSPYLRPNILLPTIARRRSEFLNKSYCKSRRINKDEIHFFTVTTLHPGNYFGAGENLRDTFILSRGKTECVLINSAEFSIQGKSEQLRILKREREEALPSNNSLYKRFQVNRKWHEYRNKLLQEVLNRKAVLKCGSHADVPRSILNEPTIPRDLICYNQVDKKQV